MLFVLIFTTANLEHSTANLEQFDWLRAYRKKTCLYFNKSLESEIMNTVKGQNNSIKLIFP